MTAKKVDHLVIRNVTSTGQYLPYEIMTERMLEMFRNQVSFNMHLHSFNDDSIEEDYNEFGHGRLYQSQEKIKAWCNQNATGFWSFTSDEIGYNNDVFTFYFEHAVDKSKFVKNCLMMLKLAA